MQRIGGSDISKLLGLSPYGGPFEVYQRIVDGVDTGWNKAMERGAAIEPVLRAHGQRMFGLELEDTASDYCDHPTAEFARAQIDDLARWNGVPVCVDYKSVSRWAKGWGAAGTDEVPEHIRAQMTWELSCADRELGLLVAGFGEDVEPPKFFDVTHVLVYEVQRDPEFERYCMLVARGFWERHVLTRTPPPITERVKKKRAAK